MHFQDNFHCPNSIGLSPIICQNCPDQSTTSLRTQTIVLFICKTKSRLRRRHCGLARHFKTDPTATVALCFGYAKTLFWRRRHFGLARHVKTDPTKTVALCFGYAKTLCWQADGRADEQDKCFRNMVKLLCINCVSTIAANMECTSTRH
jgi:hypothetical protein